MVAQGCEDNPRMTPICVIRENLNPCSPQIEMRASNTTTGWWFASVVERLADERNSNYLLTSSGPYPTLFSTAPAVVHISNPLENSFEPSGSVVPARPVVPTRSRAALKWACTRVLLPVALGLAGFAINCIPIEIFPGVYLSPGSGMA